MTRCEQLGVCQGYKLPCYKCPFKDPKTTPETPLGVGEGVGSLNVNNACNRLYMFL